MSVSTAPTLDAEYGRPLLPAQRAIAVSHHINDLTAEIEKETIVLPNAAFMFAEMDGVRRGEHVLTSTQYSHAFVTQDLPAYAEHVCECDECEHHKDRSMILLDPEEAFA